MEINQEKRSTRTNITHTKTFQIEASEKAFQILSSNLYKDVERAIVRELSCNAIDAEKTVGYQGGIEVSLPTAMNPTFFVRDHGVGMSEEEVYSLYTTYFASSKTKSNDQIGALGLGSKTPFAYTDSFQVRTTKNGETCIFAAIIDEDRMPVVSLLSKEPAAEGECGTEVSFPVLPADMQKFITAAVMVFASFESLPNITSGKEAFVTEFTQKFGYHRLDDPFEKYAAIRKFFSRNSFYDNSSSSRHLHEVENFEFIRRFCNEAYNGKTIFATMGGITYPLDMQVLLSKEVLGDADYALMSHLKSNGYLNDMLINILTPIGAVNIAPSREELTYDSRTVAYLRKQLVSSIFSLFNHSFNTKIEIPSELHRGDVLSLYRETIRCDLMKTIISSFAKDSSVGSYFLNNIPKDVVESYEKAEALIQGVQSTPIPRLTTIKYNEPSRVYRVVNTTIGKTGIPTLFGESVMFVTIPEARRDALHTKFQREVIYDNTPTFIRGYDVIRNKLALIKSYRSSPDKLTACEETKKAITYYNDSNTTLYVLIDPLSPSDRALLAALKNPPVIDLDKIVKPTVPGLAGSGRTKLPSDDESTYIVYGCIPQWVDGKVKNVRVSRVTFGELRKIAKHRKVYYLAESAQREGKYYYGGKDKDWSPNINDSPQLHENILSNVERFINNFRGDWETALLTSSDKLDAEGLLDLYLNNLPIIGKPHPVWDSFIVVKVPYRVWKAEKLWMSKTMENFLPAFYKMQYRVYAKGLKILSNPHSPSALPAFSSHTANKKLLELIENTDLAHTLFARALRNTEQSNLFKVLSKNLYNLYTTLAVFRPVAHYYDLPKPPLLGLEEWNATYLPETGSTDSAISERYPLINLFKGSGSGDNESVALSTNSYTPTIRGAVADALLSYVRTVEELESLRERCHNLEQPVR